eukprot:3154443-Pyramimonas_sp.AAC.1
MRQFFQGKLASAGVSDAAQLVGHFRIKAHKKHDGQEQRCTAMWHLFPRHDHCVLIDQWMQLLFQYEGGVRLHGPAPRGPLDR